MDSSGLSGYAGVFGQWCPYWLCRYMWTVVALVAMQVYVDSGDLIGYVGVCGQWCPYWLCRCMWIVVALVAM